MAEPTVDLYKVQRTVAPAENALPPELRFRTARQISPPHPDKLLDECEPLRRTYMRNRADRLSVLRVAPECVRLRAERLADQEVGTAANFFDSMIVSMSKQVLNFLGNVLESSTDYFIIVKDLTGGILLRSEDASLAIRRKSLEVLAIRRGADVPAQSDRVSREEKGGAQGSL